MAIVIIADDLSGAAELAGIAFARGYTAEVQRQFDPASVAEVIAVDTDSRGLSPEIAADRVRVATRSIMASRPAWIFKKVDSILRGNVRAEIEAVLKQTGLQRALLVPANPSRGRTLSGGQCLIDTQPLDQTPLAHDPEHPRRTAAVIDLLGTGRVAVHLVAPRTEPPRRGIVVPDEVQDVNQLQGLAGQYGPETLPSGAADFFTTLLMQRGRRTTAQDKAQHGLALHLPALMVCGSRTAWPQRSSECLLAGVSVRTFPPLYEGASTSDIAVHACAAIAAKRMASARKLLMGVGPIESAASPAELLSRLASLAASTLEQTPVATLLLEGGATAAAVVQRLGWTRFTVVDAAPAGIGILRPLGVADAPHVWIKPGSYAWPEEVWRSLQ